MTQLGHSLTGAIIAILTLPPWAVKKRAAAQIFLFAVLANIPDARFPNWGHQRYAFSHSIFVNLALILIVGALVASNRYIHQAVGGWKVILSGGAAWLSHMLLDSFYSHGYGIAIFWPFSAARLALPIPWFSVMRSSVSLSSPETLRIYALEFVSFFPLILLACLARNFYTRKRLIGPKILLACLFR